MSFGAKAVPVERFGAGKKLSEFDSVVLEQPLEIRLNKKSLSVTMRTPGHDLDLVIGFLFTEGLLGVRELPVMKKVGANVIEVKLAPNAKLLRRLKSRFFTSSSCGLCGRSALAQIRRRLGVIKTEHWFPAAILQQLPHKMRLAQENFAATGGLHAAALFDKRGTLLVVREDVGRHNAVDKAIGSLLRGATPAQTALLLVSGRASFEIIQKALAAKIPIVAAVSAPSSMAIELAQESGMTLVGFLRGENFNVYCRGDRLA